MSKDVITVHDLMQGGKDDTIEAQKKIEKGAKTDDQLKKEEEIFNLLKEALSDLSDDEKTSWKIIQDLARTDFKGSNKAQNKGVQLLKGLANAGTKDDPNEVADSFMGALSDAYTNVAQDVADKFDLELDVSEEIDEFIQMKLDEKLDGVELESTVKVSIEDEERYGLIVEKGLGAIGDEVKVSLIGTEDSIICSIEEVELV